MCFISTICAEFFVTCQMSLQTFTPTTPGYLSYTVHTPVAVVVVVVVVVVLSRWRFVFVLFCFLLVCLFVWLVFCCCFFFWGGGEVLVVVVVTVNVSKFCHFCA